MDDFVIDSPHLLHSTARRAENRQQEIAGISSGIESLAKELDVPVIELRQLGRDSGPTGEVEPTLARSCTRFEGKANVSDQDAPN